METTTDKSLELVLRSSRGTSEPRLPPVDRVNFNADDWDVEEDPDEGRRVPRDRRKRETCRLDSGRINPGAVSDMTISRSCRHSFSAPVMLWTTVFLVLIARGVHSVSDDHSRFSRSPKYDQDADVPGGYAAPNAQDAYSVMHLIQELIQRQQQRANQQQQQQLQVYNNGEDLSDGQMDWRRVPLPLLYQIRSIISDGSKEEDKRGSYMSLCHFKICNLG